MRLPPVNLKPALIAGKDKNKISYWEKKTTKDPELNETGINQAMNANNKFIKIPSNH